LSWSWHDILSFFNFLIKCAALDIMIVNTGTNL
jgi:hypothetical protein